MFQLHGNLQVIKSKIAKNTLGYLTFLGSFEHQNVRRRSWIEVCHFILLYLEVKSAHSQCIIKLSQPLKLSENFGSTMEQGLLPQGRSDKKAKRTRQSTNEGFHNEGGTNPLIPTHANNVELEVKLGSEAHGPGTHQSDVSDGRIAEGGRTVNMGSLHNTHIRFDDKIKGGHGVKDVQKTPEKHVHCALGDEKLIEIMQVEQVVVLLPSK